MRKEELKKAVAQIIDKVDRHGDQLLSHRDIRLIIGSVGRVTNTLKERIIAELSTIGYDAKVLPVCITVASKPAFNLKHPALPELKMETTDEHIDVTIVEKITIKGFISSITHEHFYGIPYVIVKLSEDPVEVSVTDSVNGFINDYAVNTVDYGKVVLNTEGYVVVARGDDVIKTIMGTATITGFLLDTLVNTAEHTITSAWTNNEFRDLIPHTIKITKKC